MSLFLVKVRNLMSDVTGLEYPFIDAVASKGVVNAAAAVFFGSMLRIIYRGYDVLGSFLIPLTFKTQKEHEPIPPIKNRIILRLSVAEISEQIRKRKITAEEVVRTFLGRVSEVNDIINAVVDERAEYAIDEARRIDKIIQSGEFDESELKDKFPLLGVPFTIKDSFCVEGLRHTAGLYTRKDLKAERDAQVVKIFKKAGAIPIAVTNVSELCMWWESVNTVYGRSNNPYDTRHITGGSSGGEAALQATSGSGFGIGSDIAGSVRMPAFFCGVFGHKPSSGLISNDGQVPAVSGKLSELLTTGPIVRHAEDLRVLFDLMVGDKISEIKKCPEFSRLRIYYMDDDGGSPLTTPVDKEMRDAMKKTLDHFEKKFGLKPQRAKLPQLYHSLEIWAQIMTGSGHDQTFCEELVDRKGKINPYWELLKFSFNSSVHTLPAIILGMLEKIAYAGRQLPRHQEMIDSGKELAKAIQDLLREDAILFYPSHPNTAPRHNVPFFRPGDFSYTAIFNCVGVPVTQVPLGLDSKGLPLGVQIVGGLNCDHLTIGIAQELQDAFGGWVTPGE